MPEETARLPVEGKLASFDGATSWLNSEPLTPEGLRGKVVVVDFLTYTCINWLRTLPYVRAWAEKYRDAGVVTVGMHTPEFSFEKNLDNITGALKEMDVRFPIGVDSDYGVWNAFDNHYWPALYFADAEGRIRHHRFGEGEYEQSEGVIQQLLLEAGVDGFDRSLVEVEGQGPEAEADWGNIQSPETYVGYGRGENFASGDSFVPDAMMRYRIPDSLWLNSWALSGDWTVGAEAAVMNEPNGRIAFRFHARDLHLVMGPVTRDMAVPFRVLLDGNPPGEDAGGDVEPDGSGRAVEQRMYQLIRQQGPITDRTFEIEFQEAGAEACVFTFG
jgi:thiol-disulfide isomerase/thioredoxin